MLQLMQYAMPRLLSRPYAVKGTPDAVDAVRLGVATPPPRYIEKIAKIAPKFECPLPGLNE
jgi:hypothetical protein